MGNIGNYIIEEPSYSYYGYRGQEEYIIYIAGIIFNRGNNSSCSISFIKG